MKIIFTLDKHGYYVREISQEANGLCKVSSFLAGEARGIEHWWIKFLYNNDPKAERQGNVLYLRKDAPKVFIGWYVEFTDPFPDPNEYETTIEQLVAAIEAWNTLRDQKPAKIILEVDGPNIKLHSEN